MSDTAETVREFGKAEVVAAPSAPSPALGVTTLDALRALVQETIESEPIEVNVPARPGMSVRYSTTLEAALYQSWLRQCKDRSSASGYDDLRLSATVLAAQCVSIVVNEQEVLDGQGATATFRSPEVISMFGARDAVGCVTAAFANDGHVLATAEEVVRECGYGAEVAKTVDPTKTR